MPALQPLEIIEAILIHLYGTPGGLTALKKLCISFKRHGTRKQITHLEDDPFPSVSDMDSREFVDVVSKAPGLLSLTQTLEFSTIKTSTNFEACAVMISQMQGHLLNVRSLALEDIALAHVGGEIEVLRALVQLPTVRHLRLSSISMHILDQGPSDLSFEMGMNRWSPANCLKKSTIETLSVGPRISQSMWIYLNSPGCALDISRVEAFKLDASTSRLGMTVRWDPFLAFSVNEGEFASSIAQSVRYLEFKVPDSRGAHLNLESFNALIELRLSSVLVYPDYKADEGSSVTWIRTLISSVAFTPTLQMIELELDLRSKHHRPGEIGYTTEWRSLLAILASAPCSVVIVLLVNPGGPEWITVYDDRADSFSQKRTVRRVARDILDDVEMESDIGEGMVSVEVRVRIG